MYIFSFVWSFSVVLPNGLDVLWDGKSKLQIFANSSLFDKTKVRKFEFLLNRFDFSKIYL